VLTLAALGGIGYIVGQQLTALANGLPDYQENIENKLSRVIRPGERWAAQRLTGLADRATAKGTIEVSLAASGVAHNGAASTAAATSTPGVPVVGLAVEDTSDLLILKMPGQLVSPAGCALEIILEVESPLEFGARIAEIVPRLVVLSHLPPGGLTRSRYLVRRLRAQFEHMPFLVGRWGERGGGPAAAESLVGMGATHVAFSLADARDRIVAAVRDKAAPTSLSPPIPAGAPVRGNRA
jgi:hypothetical protein